MTTEEEAKLKEQLENVCKKYIKEFELKHSYQPDVLFISYQKRRDVFAQSDSFKVFGDFNGLFDFGTSADKFDNIKSVFNLLNEINFNRDIQYFYCHKQINEIINDCYVIGNLEMEHIFTIKDN